jgi:hypothetical protein
MVVLFFLAGSTFERVAAVVMAGIVAASYIATEDDNDDRD